MNKGLLLILVLGLNACTNHKIHSDRVFSNAQVLYQKKEPKTQFKEAALQKPSYFLELGYEKGQTKLTPLQAKKIEALLSKIIYPDEYKIYASFGSSHKKNKVSNLAPVLKRAEDIKGRFGKRVKEFKVAYLKNQKSDCVYIRLLG